MEIAKTSLKLFIITLIAAACLGAVNSVTKPIIAANDEAAKKEAMAQVLPGLTGLTFSDETLTDAQMGVTSYYTAKNSGPDCYVFFVTTKGDQGDINCAIGMDGSGKTLGVQIVSHNETPGLGANAATPEFLGKYTDKTGPFSVVKSAAVQTNEIEAISSATHTTQAVTDAVNAALTFYNNNLR